MGKHLLPDSFGVTVEMEDGNELGDVSCMLQVIYRIIQVPLPLLVKVDQSRCTCDDMPQLCPTVPDASLAYKNLIEQYDVLYFSYGFSGFGLL